MVTSVQLLISKGRMSAESSRRDRPPSVEITMVYTYVWSGLSTERYSKERDGALQESRKRIGGGGGGGGRGFIDKQRMNVGR